MPITNQKVWNENEGRMMGNAYRSKCTKWCVSCQKWVCAEKPDFTNEAQGWSGYTCPKCGAPIINNP